jgi:exodeoxyribonuclease V alpha subunit
MKETIDVHKIFAEYFEGCEALAYALSSKLAEGNLCIDIDEYKIQLPILLENQLAREKFKKEDQVFWTTPDEFEKQCTPSKYVTLSADELKPFVLQGRKAYLHRYFQYETQIINNIKRLGNNFHIITGGPGSGKTYSVGFLLEKEFRENPGLKVSLAAPTGKAATRMNEALRDFAIEQESKIDSKALGKLKNLEAKTLHRLLGYMKDSVFFRYGENDRLPYDIVIVDECSMIDGALMAKLLNAIGDETKLWLIGDKDQLASVEAGSIFGDLCHAANSAIMKGKVDIKNENWRFEADKGIGKFSREVIGGELIELSDYEKDRQIMIDTAYSQELFEKYAILYRDYIEKDDIEEALKLLNRVRFLCVTRESTFETNQKIRNFLGKNVSGFKPLADGFYHNQPVIVTQNDYSLNIFNGDVGIIRILKIKGKDTYYAFFPDSKTGVRKIPAGYLSNYDTVFAMTIHKSQGSEFEHVVVIISEDKGKKLQTKELLYTAVTRAKTKKGSEHDEPDSALHKVLVQATNDSIGNCVKTSVKRGSGLETRLNTETL